MLIISTQGTSVYVSTFTLTAIAVCHQIRNLHKYKYQHIKIQIQLQVDRYQTIMHPFSSRPSLSATLAIIAALDLVSLLVLTHHPHHLHPPLTPHHHQTSRHYIFIFIIVRPAVLDLVCRPILSDPHI